MPFATVLIPTHNHGELLTRSVRSALSQTVSDIEIVILGDGISEEGRDAAHDMLRLDARVRFVDAPKGARHGEAARHAIVANVESRIVCYLSDDDLYVPTHVEHMGDALVDADFAHALPVYIEPEGTIGVRIVDLSVDSDRDLLLLGQNRIPLSAAAHTSNAYRRLPFGWRTTPPGTPTDLYMWQQFLATPGMRFALSRHATVIGFPDPDRRSWTREARLAEIDAWMGSVLNAQWQLAFAEEVREAAMKHSASSSTVSAVAALALVQRFPVAGAETVPFVNASTSRRDFVLGFYARNTGIVEVVCPQTQRFNFGPAQASWSPLCGDWDGDGVASIGLYDPEHAVFYLRNAMSWGHADLTIPFGAPGGCWIPLAGDWLGTDRDSVGLYDPQSGVFHLRASLDPHSSTIVFAFGGPNGGLVPIVGDWAGIGADRIGLYDPSTSVFMLRHSLESGDGDEVVRFGPSGQRWMPFSRVSNGSTRAAVALIAPRLGTVYVRSAD